MGFLGVVANEEGYRLLDRIAQVRPVSGITICRLQGQHSFANVDERIDRF
jgi:MFS superfamily sulfate permease-like transporter